MNTKTDLVTRAKTAIEREAQIGSDARWDLGQAAAEWIQLGETDRSLALEIRRSRTSVTQLRLIWDRFGGCPTRPLLSWQHHRAVFGLDPSRAADLLNQAHTEQLSANQLARLVSSRVAPDLDRLVSEQLAAITALTRRITQPQLLAVATRLQRLETRLRLKIEAIS